MEVILLERIVNLGQMGDVVQVKNGYGRNYLLPQGKALRANKENRAHFEKNKATLEARNLERKTEAEKVKEKLDGQEFVILRQSSEAGQLYGSVRRRDVATEMETKKFHIDRKQVQIKHPIKTIGAFDVTIALHPEIDTQIKLIVARTKDEAKKLAKGEQIFGDTDNIDNIDNIESIENIDNVENIENIENTNKDTTKKTKQESPQNPKDTKTQSTYKTPERKTQETKEIKAATEMLTEEIKNTMFEEGVDVVALADKNNETFTDKNNENIVDENKEPKEQGADATDTKTTSTDKTE